MFVSLCLYRVSISYTTIDCVLCRFSIIQKHEAWCFLSQFFYRLQFCTLKGFTAVAISLLAASPGIYIAAQFGLLVLYGLVWRSFCRRYQQSVKLNRGVFFWDFFCWKFDTAKLLGGAVSWVITAGDFFNQLTGVLLLVPTQLAE